MRLNMIQEQQLKDAFRIAEHRIAALEDVVKKLTAKFEYNSDGYCSICDAYHLQQHGADCEFLKARAVLEGK